MSIVEQSVSPQPIIRIRPVRGWNGIDLREMWEHRDFVEAMIRRDLKMRYKQTFAGVVWVLGQPILTTILLSAVITRLTQGNAGAIPYPLFVYCALVPWAFFSHAMTKVTVAFVEHAGMLTRVYFPRLLLPLAIILAAGADFIIAFLFLPVLMIYYHVVPSLAVLAMPLVLLLMFITVLGMGLWLSALNAQYRDISYALPFILQVGLFVTPMFYSSDIVPMPLRLVYALNPMVGVVEGMRWALLNPPGTPPWAVFAASTLAAVVLVTSGLYFFQRRALTLADVV
jgi:lipopolysaccharide transport system permease protein